MYGAELYRRLAAETGTDPSWHEVGSLRLASSPERFEELRRQAGWAKTFGLPLELISAEEAQALFPLMSTDGVLGAVWLPTDGWLDPSGLAQALAAGARARGATIRPHTRVVAIATRAGPGHRRRPSSTGASGVEIRADVVVNAGGMFAPEIGRMAGVTVPIIPMAHQYLFTEPIEGVHAGPAAAARPGQPRLLPRGGRRAVHGRLRARPGAVVPRRRPGRLQRQAARARLAALRADHGGRDPPRPGDRGRGRDPDHQRARGVHAGQRVHPRRDARSAGSSSPPASGPTGSPARAGSGGRWRAGSSMASPSSTCGRWTSAGSAPRTGRRRHTLARTIENYATYYDIHYPNEERQAGRPLRMSPDVRDPAPSSARPSARSPAGSARTGSSRTRPPATRRSGRAAGRASTGRRRSAPRRSRRDRRPACSTRRSSPRSRSAGRARRRSSSRLCANDVDRPVGLDHLHPAAQPARRDRGGPHGHPPRGRTAT